MGEGTVMKLLVVMCLMLFSVIAFGQEDVLSNPDWIPVDPVLVLPEWLEGIVLSLKSLPMVGVILALGLKWASVFYVSINAFAGAAVVSLRALSTVLTSAGLVAFIPKVEAFAQGKFMWYLKYFSNMNAQKTEKK